MLSREEILAQILRMKKSGEITPTDKLASLFLFILSNESIFIYYLTDLNNKLREHLSETKLPPAPVSYSIIHSAKFPHPPQTQCEDTEKLLLALNRVLLEQEKKHGVNKDRTVETIPEFVGQVPSQPVDKLLNEGGLWNDNNFDFSGLIHGRFSHRIQHYIITRYIEDKLAELTTVLPVDRSALFKYLVSPHATTRFFTAANYSRGYWNVVLDNDKDNPNAYFIQHEPNLTAPVVLSEYLLTAKSFNQFPYLAHCIYASMCYPIFAMANQLQISSLSVLKLYEESINSKRPDNVVLNAALQACLQKLTKNPGFTPTVNMSGYEGIINLSAPAPEKETKLKGGFFTQDLKAQTKARLFEKYKIKPTDNLQADLEKLLRTIAANANADDLETLLNMFGVNLDARDSRPGSARTALHQAIIKAYEHPEKFEAYRACVDLLISRGARKQEIDANQKTPDYYDKDNRFRLRTVIEPAF